MLGHAAAVFHHHQLVAVLLHHALYRGVVVDIAGGNPADELAVNPAAYVGAGKLHAVLLAKAIWHRLTQVGGGKRRVSHLYQHIPFQAVAPSRARAEEQDGAQKGDVSGHAGFAI